MRAFASVFSNFYARLSLVFLLLVSALGISCLVIAFNYAGHLFDEVEQLLNRNYAKSIADEIAPLVDKELSVDRIGSAIHYMMVLNPMVEIYILDENGGILAFFTHPGEKIVRTSVDIEPIVKFLETDGKISILGEDPRNLSGRKPFSAARLTIGKSKSYVYIILRGQSYDRSFEAIKNSYYVQAALVAFVITMGLAVITGLSLFFIITRRLRALSATVRSFRPGELNERVVIKGNDEIAALGRTFNDMAEAIERGVRELEESERMRKEIVSNISHDLRGPLASVDSYLETILLRDEHLSSEERKRFISVCIKNLASFQALMDKLLELVMLESKQLVPKKEPLELSELVQDVAVKLEPAARSANVSIELNPQPDTRRMVNADIGLIERVITNIVDNAIRYSPAGGTVSISVEGSKEALFVSVEDSGKGISEADLPHIFERFYRGDKSRTRSGSHSGLGLAIAKQIIELHGGSIIAWNLPGGGAMFKFGLPFDKKM